jgi:rSAM/selenodomain-associated transferase 1
MTRDALIIFGRQPVPGKVKTRLAREIGPKEACQVYRKLLELTLRVAQKSKGEKYLYLPPDDLADDINWPCHIRNQKGSDLGSRMEQAFKQLFAEGFQKVVLIGSDCPYINDSTIGWAFSCLTYFDTVFGPAADGGYYLVGQREKCRKIFSNIPWSTDQVWSQTRIRLESNHFSYFELNLNMKSPSTRPTNSKISFMFVLTPVNVSRRRYSPTNVKYSKIS